MKRYHKKYTDAKRSLKEAIEDKECKAKVWDRFQDMTIYDLGKHRKIRRYFIGHYIEWVNL